MSGAGQVNMNGHDNKLQIKNATYNDSGSYVCMATSILGKAQKTVNLTVEGDADYGITLMSCVFHREAVTCSVGDNRFPLLSL